MIPQKIQNRAIQGTMSFIHSLKKMDEIKVKKLFVFDKEKFLSLLTIGDIQRAIITRAKAMGLFVMGIDPFEDAVAKEYCDAFEVIGGQGFEGMIAVAKKYNVSAIVTAATDKPLVMMARVAKELALPFYSRETKGCNMDFRVYRRSFDSAQKLDYMVQYHLSELKYNY